MASSTVAIRPSWTCLNTVQTTFRCSSIPLITSHALSIKYCRFKTIAAKLNPDAAQVQKHQHRCLLNRAKDFRSTVPHLPFSRTQSWMSFRLTCLSRVLVNWPESIRVSRSA
uniref:(northern house mosquito) hypothetical protein n=1 Tax=Culex pipiens TaxID=7175 RepID=A0A8D8N3L8_CULPI